MHGDFIKKDKNGFNLYERNCPKCKKTSVTYKHALSSICKRCANSKRRRKHGYAYHPLYCVWETIIQRCENPRAKSYPCYGAKGIKMCPEWRNNPQEFIKWGQENGYKEGLVIDRIDSNYGYNPDNCRFVTQEENCKNINFAKKLTWTQVREIRDRLSEGEEGIKLAKDFNVSPSTISAINKNQIWNKDGRSCTSTYAE